jgi:hypothetical protein
MSKLRQLHAAGFNILARAFGVIAIIAGLIFIIWGFSLVLDHKATIDVDGVPSSDPWIKGGVLVVGLVASTIGVLVLMARPYRPKD